MLASYAIYIGAANPDRQRYPSAYWHRWDKKLCRLQQERVVRARWICISRDAGHYERHANDRERGSMCGLAVRKLWKQPSYKFDGFRSGASYQCARKIDELRDSISASNSRQSGHNGGDHAENR